MKLICAGHLAREGDKNNGKCIYKRMDPFRGKKKQKDRLMNRQKDELVKELEIKWHLSASNKL